MKKCRWTLLVFLLLPLCLWAKSGNINNFVDAPTKIQQAIAQYEQARAISQEMKADGGFLTSTDYAKREYFKQQIRKFQAEAKAELERPRRITSNGKELGVSYSGLDLKSKTFIFAIIVDFGFVKQSFTISIPFSDMIPGMDLGEPAEYYENVRRLDEGFQSNKIPFIFDLTYSVSHIGANRYSPLYKDISIWNADTGQLLENAENVKIQDIVVSNYQLSALKLEPVFEWDPHEITKRSFSGSPQYRNKNPFGMTKSLDALSKKSRNMLDKERRDEIARKQQEEQKKEEELKQEKSKKKLEQASKEKAMAKYVETKKTLRADTMVFVPQIDIGFQLPPLLVASPGFDFHHSKLAMDFLVDLAGFANSASKALFDTTTRVGFSDASSIYAGLGTLFGAAKFNKNLNFTFTASGGADIKIRGFGMGFRAPGDYAAPRSPLVLPAIKIKCGLSYRMNKDSLPVVFYTKAIITAAYIEAGVAISFEFG